MNEMNYSPDKEPGFSAVLKRQAETHADFTYSLSGNVISIVDLNLGNRSLTNDIESVLRKIEHYHQGSIVGFNIMYRDYLHHSIVACSLGLRAAPSRSCPVSDSAWPPAGDDGQKRSSACVPNNNDADRSLRSVCVAAKAS